jgi:uncharacterized membrane protein YgcG
LKKLICLFLFCSALGAARSQSGAAVPARPAYARMFNDENAYASYHASWRKLEDKLISHAKRTGKQVVWIMIPTTHGNSIDELATAVFREWGIGNKERNTGLLVLIARKEKQVRIETGYGLEGDVPDVVAAKIIREIIQPSFDSLDFILPPLHATRGYLPAVERAIDTLISLTQQPDAAALRSGAKLAAKKKERRWIRIVLTGLGILAGWVLLNRGWRWFNYRMEQTPASVQLKFGKKKQRKAERTTTGQYSIPVALVLLVALLTILLHWNWFVFTGVFIFLFLRWIYYLPSPVLSAETIRFNREWEARRAVLKKEYLEKKKILGKESQYPSFDAYWARYLELGIDKLEKELQEGHYAPKAMVKKKKYGAGALLYAIFLGSSNSEKKSAASGPSGYSGESSGGQQAGDLGGGSSGGGGASS